MPNKTTDLQRKFILEMAKSEDGQSLFMQEFKKKSSSIKVNKESIPKGLRTSLNSVLLSIPFENLKVDEETYEELATKEIEKMEWGVIQKVISIFSSISPERIKFPNFEEVLKIKKCTHTSIESRKYCGTCFGKGRLTTDDSISNEEITIICFSELLKNFKIIKDDINSQVSFLKEEIIEDIWFNNFDDRKRYDANGIIAKTFGKQGNIIQM